MLRKRIIFTLIYSDNYFNQSRNFRLQKVGDLNWLENYYKFTKISHSIDELIIVNASRNEKVIKDFAETINKLVKNVFIPICAGGGIKSVEDANYLFQSGADKIIINSLLYNQSNTVKKIIQKFGSQSVVASIDYKIEDKNINIYIQNGQKKIDINLFDYINHIQDIGVGEIYLNSINQDGTGFGYDFETINSVKNQLKIPLIIAGGAGNVKHLFEGIKLDEVSAVATANLFNFMGNGLPIARDILIKKNINLANWQEI
jgi:cyclase